MKANKAQVVSNRTRLVVAGAYAPKFEEETPRVRRNPYDSPYSNLPRYNGRIKWQTMGLVIKSKEIYRKIRKFFNKNTCFKLKKKIKKEKEIVEYPERFTSLQGIYGNT